MDFQTCMGLQKQKACSKFSCVNVMKTAILWGISNQVFTTSCPLFLNKCPMLYNKWVEIQIKAGGREILSQLTAVKLNKFLCSKMSLRGLEKQIYRR